MALSFYNAFDLPLTIARPFNTYGPRQSARAVIPTIISQIAPVRRSQMGVSENRIILVLAVLRTVGGVRTGTLYSCLTAAHAPA